MVGCSHTCVLESSTKVEVGNGVSTFYSGQVRHSPTINFEEYTPLYPSPTTTLQPPAH